MEFLKVKKDIKLSIKSHPYHIVSPSSWPYIIALGVFTFTTGGVYYVHTGIYTWFALGTIIMLAGIYSWAYDILIECSDPNINTKDVQLNFLTGMVLFILSEIMIFFYLFWAFFILV